MAFKLELIKVILEYCSRSGLLRRAEVKTELGTVLERAGLFGSLVSC